MKTITKALTKGAIGTVAVGAMVMTSAAPAFARDYRNSNRVDVGDIIAGAVILGGIAAIASATGSNTTRYQNNRRGYHNNRGYPRRAVERCVRAVERDAHRAGYRFADVTEIRDVDRRRGGWEVRGRLVVDGNRYARNNRYDRGNRYNRGNGYNADRGRFTCGISRGQLSHISYRGIRGLR